MPTKPEILATKEIAKTRLFRVEEVHLRFSNGEERHFERLAGGRGESVIIVPMLDNDRFLLVREYGAGVDDYYLSLPAGAVDANEDAAETVKRELAEEVGYSANQVEELMFFSTSPAYTARPMRVFLAQELFEKRLTGDEPEPIEVVEWRLSNLAELIARDDFYDPKSMAALYYVRDRMNAG